MNLHDIREPHSVRVTRAIAALEQIHPGTYEIIVIDGEVHWTNKARGTTGVLDLDYWNQLYQDNYFEGRDA